eukprot:758146-Hanusia_phi.AAC.2
MTLFSPSAPPFPSSSPSPSLSHLLLPLYPNQSSSHRTFPSWSKRQRAGYRWREQRRRKFGRMGGQEQEKEQQQP